MDSKVAMYTEEEMEKARISDNELGSVFGGMKNPRLSEDGKECPNCGEKSMYLDSFGKYWICRICSTRERA